MSASFLGVGWALMPDVETLALTAELARAEPDYYEVMPETTWREGPDATLAPNGFHREFLALKAATGKPFVAHGVAFSLAGTGPGETARRQRWLEQLHRDHAEFDFHWYTDHAGITRPAGQGVALPLPPPMTLHAARLTRRRLQMMQSVVPDAGLENAVWAFMTAAPLREPWFLMQAINGPRLHLLLDLHNLYTHAVNFGVDVDAWLAQIDLSRVIEIHLSGGSMAPPHWLPEGPALRLDSHDTSIPEEVFKLFERVMPLCPNLRGVTLERMEQTATQADVPRLRDELRRIRRMLVLAGRLS